MKTPIITTCLICLLMAMSACSSQEESRKLAVEIVETSAAGNKLAVVEPSEEAKASAIAISLKPDETFQTITGIGGSFTEASAYLLNQLSEPNRRKILEAYFSDAGARYSLTRTHINSCDFSLGNYSYAPVEGDKDLVHFSIDEDRPDLIPMIKEAQEISSE
ncbi:MAG: glycosyl hydrolase family 30, partial [Bacteroidota bacterium]